MRTVVLSAAMIAAAVFPCAAQERFQEALDAYTGQIASDCASFENGQFEMSPDAVLKVVDVNADGITDPIVDAGAMSCSSSATLTSGGSGGRDISVFVSQPDGDFLRFAFLGEGILPLGLGTNTVLIVPKHGSNCDMEGNAVCYAAHVWNGNGFVSGGDKVDVAQE